MQGFEFNTVRRIISGAGSALQLADQCRRLGVSRPLLVTDPGLMAIGLVQPVLAALEAEGLAAVVFDQVREDPPEATVLAAADQGRSQGVDGVLAVGGGSSMDVAKVVAVLLGGQQALAQIYGVGNVTGQRLPLVLVPTTAGTGSEVTPVSIITVGENEKRGVSSPLILPDIALLDYFLEKDFTGMDVLKKIKKRFPETQVIFLTASDDVNIAVDTMRNGAYDYIVKGDTAFIRIRHLLKKISEENERKAKSRSIIRFQIYVIIAIILISLLGILYFHYFIN